MHRTPPVAARLVALRATPLALACTLLALVPAAGAATSAPVTAQVVNGSTMTDAEYRERWPFVAAIVNAGARNQYDGQFCGGTLVDDQHVVTAAHCLSLGHGVQVAPGAIRVVAGTRTLDRTSLGTGAAAARRVIEVFVHPGFAENAGEGFRHDVAVLRLSEPVAGAVPLRLVQPAEDAIWGSGLGSRVARLAGWGDTDPLERGAPANRYPADLRAAAVPIHHDGRCSSTVGGGYGTAFERATNLCAGTLQDGNRLGVDACQGDSGGPLVADAADGTPRLVGITSWGDGCGERSFGAYSRIAALRGWIDSIPGATDGGAAIGGPAGTLGVAYLRSRSSGFSSVRLAWSAADGGTPPERFSIWRRVRVRQTTADQLVGITVGTTFRAPAPATRRANAYTWVVRPLDAEGSAGPVATIAAGPRPDRVRPTRPGPVRLVAGSRLAFASWGGSRDAQSGMARYQLQRRIVGRTGFALVDTSARLARRAPVVDLRTGDRVQVRVRALDRAGNASAWRTSPSVVVGR